MTTETGPSLPLSLCSCVFDFISEVGVRKWPFDSTTNCPLVDYLPWTKYHPVVNSMGHFLQDCSRWLYATNLGNSADSLAWWTVSITKWSGGQLFRNRFWCSIQWSIRWPVNGVVTACKISFLVITPLGSSGIKRFSFDSNFPCEHHGTAGRNNLSRRIRNSSLRDIWSEGDSLRRNLNFGEICKTLGRRWLI